MKESFHYLIRESPKGPLIAQIWGIIEGNGIWFEGQYIGCISLGVHFELSDAYYARASNYYHYPIIEVKR